MNENEKEAYTFGYDEHRLVVIHELRKIVRQKSGHKAALSAMLEEMEKSQEEDHWRNIQKESPGITREQYEADLDATLEAIKSEYYSKNGYLKPRLVRPKS